MSFLYAYLVLRNALSFKIDKKYFHLFNIQKKECSKRKNYPVLLKIISGELKKVWKVKIVCHQHFNSQVFKSLVGC